MGIINVWHTMIEPHGVRSNLPSSPVFLASARLSGSHCVIPTDRGIFQFVFLELCHLMIIVSYAMLGRISNFLDSHCRKRWSGLFWKALVLLQAVTKDFSSAVITTLISPDLLTPHPPPRYTVQTAKEEHRPNDDISTYSQKNQA